MYILCGVVPLLSLICSKSAMYRLERLVAPSVPVHILVAGFAIVVLYLSILYWTTYICEVYVYCTLYMGIYMYNSA